MPLLSLRPHPVLIGAILTLLCPAWAAIAAEPAPITDLARATSPLSAQQRRQVADYAEWWSDALADPSPDRQRRARTRLFEPLRVIGGPTLLFRDEYARQAIPLMERHVEQGTAYAAVNALQVIAAFANERALDALLPRLDASREQREAVRLWAAHGLRQVINDGSVPSHRLESAARDMARAGEREEDWLVLQRIFDALAAMDSAIGRQRQVELLRATLGRISEDDQPPSELMQTVHRALLSLRNQYLEPRLSSDERTSMGRDLAPLLAQIFTIGAQHWDEVKEDAEARTSYDGAIRLSEMLLRLVDDHVRGAEPPNTAIHRAWGNGNREGFEADVQRWQAIIEGPPYARR